MPNKAILIIGIGVVVDVIAGYLYYYFVGCASRTYTITSKPVNSNLSGSAKGGLLFTCLLRRNNNNMFF